jgi:hypothetical protein
MSSNARLAEAQDTLLFLFRQRRAQDISHHVPPAARYSLPAHPLIC